MRLLVFSALVVLLSACQPQSSDHLFQGYVSSDLTYISSSQSGELTRLPVSRGTPVAKGELLFELDKDPQQTELKQAYATMQQLRFELYDLEKGKREPYIEGIKQQIRELDAKLELAQKTFKRYQTLIKSGLIQQEQVDESRSEVEQLTHQRANLQQNLVIAELPAREDQVEAARAQLESQQALLIKARWALAQKTLHAPAKGRIFDTYYRVGEQVPANQPVLSLLDPDQLRVDFFVPTRQLSSIKPEQKVLLSDSMTHKRLTTGLVSFISPEAEYTPPVIYSEKRMQEMVYRVEVTPNKPLESGLNLGQPVSVELCDAGACN
ncbi:HlyD family secretion protein [Dongshaea marina]|uniref:HlyD family secretion protein n=1 Tax=Dongshaea marina TaxID=2047966 RepID=UPI000D3ECEBF|nr:HlyD family efflux transporter periplasmic adaptor subunit [Dongshaea marina]